MIFLFHGCHLKFLHLYVIVYLNSKERETSVCMHAQEGKDGLAIEPRLFNCRSDVDKAFLSWEPILLR
jgi:hypothetical protein